ncbi:MAG: FtsX-like permease family protein [Lachnospiraceae bacterium]|nr:FtsX-like permease family protein [Lachnospiraceae bacterium]
MKNAMIKTSIREIKGSLGRYVAILAIVMLGVAFFAGLKVTKPAMIETLDRYLEEQNFFDYRLLSTIGFTEEDVDKLSEMEGIADIEGTISLDALCSIDEGNEVVYKIHAVPETINKIVVTAGRMPESVDECVLDSGVFDESVIGSTVTVTENNDEDTLDMFGKRTFTVVGLVRSPYYINFERGTSSIGDGKVNGYIYVPLASFDSEYMTEVFVTMEEKYYVLSDEYNDYIDATEDGVEDKTEEVVMARYTELVNDAQTELDDAQAELDDAQMELDDKSAEAETELADALEEIENGEQEIADHEKEIADGKVEIQNAKDTLDTQEAELLAQETQLLAMEGMMPPEQYQASLMQIQMGKEQIKTAREEISTKEAELLSGKEELEQAKEDLEKGRKEYNDAKAEFEEEVADAQVKIDDAQLELDDAQAELDDLEEPDYYVLTRNTNVGYACFESDANIVAAVADVFPMFFFLVAALICMTTMNRMVEEQRTQIGVLKALGYSNAAIMGKFIFYAGSAAVVGAIAGFFGGTWLFPKTIWTGYSIMYDMGQLYYLFDGILAVISLIAALLCSVGTAYLSCRYELISAPANLIRPKAPKNGKRIFLEYITFIWSRMKFLHKVSFRNMIRYKKRFFMMILGISGCTALLVAGFGIKDSVANIADQQYSQIQIFDIGLTFADPMTEEERIALKEESLEIFEEMAYRLEESVDLDFAGQTKSMYLEIPENSEEISTFLDLHTEDGEPISYPQVGEAVITAKTAETLGIQIGDEVILRDNDMNQMTVTISGICENFVYNYVYMNRETYATQLGKEPEYKSAFAIVKEGIDVHEASAKASDYDNVLSVSVTEDMRGRIGNMLTSMNYIVALVILCAGALAFIVLYNLTNINITERIREIATIKVLGFYAKETADYVFRENIMLTGIGAAIGLLLGKWLHWFIMYQIRIDMVSFKTYVAPISYVWSFVLTFVFAMFVNGLMQFKLEKINMAESLKSIE